MADNKKYYYMKLKDNFFDTEEMILLESLPDGYLYTNILMKLYLRSLKDNGCLMFKGVIPYTPDVLAKVVRHNVGVVEKAIQIYKQFGLVEILDNGAIFMLDIQNFIGKSSTEADRKREFRSRIDDEKTGHLSGHLSDGSTDKNPPEKEIELEIELETEIDKKSSGRKRPTNTKFIPPTVEQVKEYCEERGNSVDPVHWHSYYSAIDWKIGKNPMKNWKAAVITWERKNTSSSTSTSGRNGQAARQQSSFDRIQELYRIELEKEEAERAKN